MPSKPIIKLEFEQAELIEIEIYKISYFLETQIQLPLRDWGVMWYHIYASSLADSKIFSRT